jgi:ribonuclease HII
MKYPTYEIEEQCKSKGYKYVVGTDEAGRGCLAGPVVAAAVFIPDEAIPMLSGRVNDSKKLSAKRREELYNTIIDNCSCGVQDISAEIIDDVNILEATKLAMKSAVEQLEYYDYILVDGTVDLSKHIWCECLQVIKGDSLSISIAAASIVAKVVRDKMMKELHEVFPIYGFDRHKGYGTQEHIKAIETYGASEFHRISFRRVGK